MSTVYCEDYDNQGAVPEGLPLGRKRATKGCSGPVLAGHNVGKKCISETASLAMSTVYCEDYDEWMKKMMDGQKGLPGGIFRARKKCEEEYITGPGTYTFALKAK